MHVSDLLYTFFHPRYFYFQGKRYRYFDHPYNTTRLNERIVEVPLIMEEIKLAQGKDILEVGNVLSHYYPIAHDVVDKYEKAPGVINQDIVSFKPKKKYDLIVSISTLEHVGWDEQPRDQTKIHRSLLHLKSLLKKNGKVVFTVPVGINDYLDKQLHELSLPIDDLRCLKRMTANNTWAEKSWAQIRSCLYDTPFQNANGIVLGTIFKN